MKKTKNKQILINIQKCLKGLFIHVCMHALNMLKTKLNELNMKIFALVDKHSHNQNIAHNFFITLENVYG